ncbi:MAG: glycosyltransferase family 4 protein [bacterium]
MNILILSTDYKPHFGGIAEHTYQVARSLYKSGTNVIVLAPFIKGCSSFDNKQGFKTYRVPNIPILRGVLFFLSALFLCCRFQIDYIYVSITFLCGEIAYILSYISKLKYIVAIHGYEVMCAKDTFRAKIRILLKPLQLHVYNKAYRIFAVSNFTKSKLEEFGVSSQKIRVVNNGVDLDKFNTRKKHLGYIKRYNLNGNKIILTVARLTEDKGHDMVIKSLPEVLKRVPKVTYLIAGIGPRRTFLESLVKEMGIQQNVIFLGYVPENELPMLYNTCNVFILTSRPLGRCVEGFGIVFLEAGACKKPVIGENSGGIPDAVINGKTGILVNSNNSGEIVKALISLLSDHNLAKKLGDNGYKRIVKELTWNKIGLNMMKEIEI